MIPLNCLVPYFIFLVKRVFLFLFIFNMCHSLFIGSLLMAGSVLGPRDIDKAKSCSLPLGNSEFSTVPH